MRSNKDKCAPWHLGNPVGNKYSIFPAQKAASLNDKKQPNE